MYVGIDEYIYGVYLFTQFDWQLKRRSQSYNGTCQIPHQSVQFLLRLRQAIFNCSIVWFAPGEDCTTDPFSKILEQTLRRLN